MPSSPRESVEISGLSLGVTTGQRTASFWREFATQKTAVVGLIIVCIAIIAAIFAPAIAPSGPFELHDSVLGPPQPAHPFGTDTVGRDVLSIIVYGTRIALLFGFGVASISLVLGIILGVIPAYFGGIVDDLFSRFFELILTVPRLVLVIVLVAFFGDNIAYTMMVVGLTFWPVNARIIRGQVLTLKQRGYVRAAVATGASHARVITLHIIPNGLYPVIANTALQMGFAILFESSLSFLGLGDPNHPSWGQLLAEANLRRGAWWMSVAPGLAISMLVASLNLVGDGINHAFNPRLRSR